jgi:hypothetical protein
MRVGVQRHSPAAIRPGNDAVPIYMEAGYGSFTLHIAHKNCSQFPAEQQVGSIYLFTLKQDILSKSNEGINSMMTYHMLSYLCPSLETLLGPSTFSGRLLFSLK